MFTRRSDGAYADDSVIPYVGWITILVNDHRQTLLLILCLLLWLSRGR